MDAFTCAMATFVAWDLFMNKPELPAAVATT
jgi:hypothetical protein